MQNNIRNTNLRFNLDKEQQRRAWEYLQTMDRQDFKSYSQVISLALVDYFDRYYRTQADPYLETREREELFVKQIVDAVENSLKQALPLFLSGLTAGCHPCGRWGGYQRDTVCPFPHCGAGSGLVPQLRDRQAFLKRIGGRRTDPAGAPGRGRTEPHLHAAPQKGGLP